MKLFVPYSQFLAYAKSLKGEEMIALDVGRGGYTVTTRFSSVLEPDDSRAVSYPVARQSVGEAQSGNAACFSRITQDGSQRDTIAAEETNLVSDGDGESALRLHRATVTLTASLPISFAPEHSFVTKIGYNCPTCSAPIYSGEGCSICEAMSRVLEASRKRRREYALVKSAERAMDDSRKPYAD